MGFLAEGLTLTGESGKKWVIISRHKKPPEHTGGNFSQGYLVKDYYTGHKAYMKVLSYQDLFATAEGNTTELIEQISKHYNFEKNMLKLARERRLDRVVTAIDSGEYKPDGGIPYPFLVFELADGDLRAQLADAQPPVVFTLSILHHVAVAIAQLHKSLGVLHHDIKPSNVLVFQEVGGKLADLGRVLDKKGTSPFSHFEFAGDRIYAPPEIIYAETGISWDQKRAIDLYQLGSLASYLFTGLHINALVEQHLDPDISGANSDSIKKASYEVALPMWQHAFAHSLKDMSSAVSQVISSKKVRGSILTAVSELCEPDFRKRGHPKNKVGHSDPYGVERYISLFNRLSVECRIKIVSSGVC